MTEKLNYYVQLLKNVQERLTKAQEITPELLSDDILHQLDEVINLLMEQSGSAYDAGQDWLVQMFTHLPQFNPAIERELLWFFGGQCLHFLGDDEIQRFQDADEDAEDTE